MKNKGSNLFLKPDEGLLTALKHITDWVAVSLKINWPLAIFGQLA